MSCPVCHSATFHAGTVDFYKTCEDPKHGPVFPEGETVPIKYRRCVGCGLCYAPEMCAWSKADFAARVYNADYHLADPDYVDARPRASARMLEAWFGKAKAEIRHIDYGGGDGKLSQLMREAGFNSHSWDPMTCGDCRAYEDRSFNLVTAFEVFEHCPDPAALRADLMRLLAAESVLVFSTLTSDSLGRDWLPEQWWYAAPRNGHVCLYTKKALRHLLYPMRTYHFSEGVHFAFLTCPKWLEVSVQSSHGETHA